MVGKTEASFEDGFGYSSATAQVHPQFCQSSGFSLILKQIQSLNILKEFLLNGISYSFDTKNKYSCKNLTR